MPDRKGCEYFFKYENQVLQIIKKIKLDIQVCKMCRGLNTRGRCGHKEIYDAAAKPLL